VIIDGHDGLDARSQYARAPGVPRRVDLEKGKHAVGLTYKDRDRVRLVSRNGRDRTRRIADLAAAVGKLSARTLVLDGVLRRP
jgi:hypothetical protein